MSQARHLAAAFALAAAASAAAARVPAWEQADGYLCRAEKLRSCAQKDASCRREPGLGVFTVNFKDNSFRVRGSDPEFAETIIARRFIQIDPARNGAPPSDVNAIYLDGGARVVQFGQPQPGERKVKATFASVYGDDVVIHYLTCEPT